MTLAAARGRQVVLRPVELRQGPDAQVRADPDALQRVLGNLLANAVQAGGDVVVTAAAPGTVFNRGEDIDL